MTYKNHYPKGWYKVDPEKVAIGLRTGSIFVHPSSPEERIRILEILESDGFNPNEGYTKAKVLESRFPLMIFLSNKSYSHLESTMGAAAIAGSGRLVTEKEFYILYYYKKLSSDPDSSLT